jgi:hypothetical protein
MIWLAHTVHSSVSISRLCKKFPPKCNPLCKKKSSKCEALAPSYGLFSPLKKPPFIIDMSLEQTVDNLEIRYANAVTFVGTSNTMIDTTTGRIQTKGIQHNSNVITDVSGPHGRVAPTLKKYPEIIFEEGKFDYNASTRTYVQAGYRVTATSSLGDSGTGPGYQPWGAFNGTTSIYEDAWVSQTVYSATAPGAATASAVEFPVSSGRRGEYIDLQMPNAIKVASFVIKTRSPTGAFIPEDSPGAGYLYGSNNGTSWTEIKAFSGLTYGGMTTNGGTQEKVEVNSTVAYKYLRLQGTHRSGVYGTDQYLSIGQIEYYGYEEYTPAGDHSVDTTFMSRFNNPQTTGVQVLVDGATGVGTNQISGGPDPSGNQSTYVTDGKYWTLDGTLTSNLAVEANTFLEGDQPHAVSVWFNSSNLEANTANTCVFSISDQEKLDSVNLDLQSNTWHNLTYAYQGEGGSRVTYLDGRKVAEDQAEDTFGEYPPFAMTGYSQGGYVVSASSLRSGHAGWHAFDKTKYAGGVGKKWASEASQGDTFTGGDSLYNGTNRLSSSTQPGAWLKIELPYKLRLQYMSLFSEPTTEQPEDFIIYGSNDDNTWDQLFQKTGATANTDYVNYMINSVSCYKYFALVVRRLISSTTIAAIDEWKLYGHRENDLVRLPDPTNVLKYPHIAMTGQPGTANGVSDTVHAQRGYVVTASSMYVDNASNPYQPWRAFNNENGSSLNGSSWVSTGLTNTYGGVNNTYGTVRSANLGSDSGGTATENGEWLKIQLPHKIVLSHIQMVGNSADTSDHPKSFKLYGSINGTAWVEVLSVTNTGSQDTSVGTTFTPVSTPDAYNYFGLVVTATQSRNNYLTLTELKLFGTEEASSIPIQIGGGNIDKVANFRVYDKFVGEDQALEIWDAQKDAFGRAKSSMTLQKGRLGIGTTEPEGRLAVLDEPHNLEEFPPRAMTAEETYMEGHGVFRVSANSYGAGSSTTRYPWKAFIKGTTESTSNGDNSWLDGSGDFNNATGVYDGSLTHHNGSVSGEYLQLELPYEIQLSSYSLAPWNYPTGGNFQYSDFPRDFIIYGSKDSISWDIVDTRSGQSSTSQADVPKYHVNSQKTYKYFVIVVTKINTAAYANSAVYVAIGEWRLFGTREQGQSVLHDGQLTLTKSLNVPRIGPALDADDTPRRDRLVVEYNTSTNPTFEGAVRDTSGRGLDGIMYTATYNASEKAIESNGNTGTSNNGPGGSASGNLNDYGSFETVLPSLQGNPVFTVSGWFKQNTIADLQLAWLFARNLRVTAQPGLSNKMHWLGITSSGRPRLALGGGGNLNLYYTDGSIKAGTWYHMVVVIEPTGTDVTQNHVRFYLDGVLQTTSNSGSSGTIDLGDGAPPRMHWLWQESSTVYYDGSVSNIKLHDTALTAEEVKTLYDMGRTGSVANPQPLHIAAPLYAPGVSIQTVAENVHDIVTYSSATSRTITPLTINIKPRFTNSKILLHWMINAEIGENNVIVVYRNGIKIGYNTSIADAIWVGLASAIYDVNMDSTIENLNISWIDTPGTTENLEYSIVVKSANTGSFPVYLNRTVASGAAGAASFERTVSFKSATEIAH